MNRRFLELARKVMWEALGEQLPLTAEDVTPLAKVLQEHQLMQQRIDVIRNIPPRLTFDPGDKSVHYTMGYNDCLKRILTLLPPAATGGG